MSEIVVIGAGPAGVAAALRAADLGAKTTLVTRDEFGGMAANDGPVPVRTLAHAARLIRNARDLGRYGIETGEPALNYKTLLHRVSEVVADTRSHSAFRSQVDRAGVTVHENAGLARFADPHTIETESGLRLHADKVIICTGGVSRQIDVPGAGFTNTHSDAWALASAPPSMIVIGAGATGVQVASIFNAFGTRIQLFQAGPRIVPTEDEDVSATVAEGFRKSGIDVREDFGRIDSFEKTETGIRMNFSKDGKRDSAEAALAIIAIGWAANTSSLQLPTAGVETNERGFITTDDFLRTSAPHVFAAGDVTGRMMLVPQGLHQGYLAATNAVNGLEMKLPLQVAPIGSFTDPEYAQVGLTESQARERYDVIVTRVDLDSTTRTIIDGRTFGFVKLIVDRSTRMILGCHVVGERAVELTQVAAIAISAGMPIDKLAEVPISFPTYAGVLGLAAAMATRTLKLDAKIQAEAVAVSVPAIL
jgi:pyruvate/2-oxoglutarate dehydrogenase complex dihydrolipoamide dehydrogenase (E3) component